MKVLVLLKPRIAVVHLTALVGSLAKEQSKQLSVIGGRPNRCQVVDRVDVATLARHQGAARELLLAPLSVEEFRIPVTETDLNAQARATDAMFVPIHLETQGPARPLAMWDLPPVMRIQPKLTSALHPVPVGSQTIQIRLQGRPAVRSRVRLARLTVVLLAGVPADCSNPNCGTG